MKSTSLQQRFLPCTAVLLATLSACVSPEKVQGYEDEIVALREERTRLKKQNQALQRQLGDYEVKLAEANMKLLEMPDEAAYPELDSLGISYGQRGDDLVFQVPSEITFASGEATLSSGGKEALRKVAGILLADYSDGTYYIEGHTDTDPIRVSDFDSNRELSMVRAMRVHSFLVEECAIPDERCVVAGYGEYWPVADNSSEEGKAKNRRVEVVVRG